MKYGAFLRDPLSDPDVSCIVVNVHEVSEDCVNNLHREPNPSVLRSLDGFNQNVTRVHFITRFI